MLNIFKSCCLEDPKGSMSNSIRKMELNGHVASLSCPFSGANAQQVGVNGENKDSKSVKPNLRINVAPPITLKNYDDSDYEYSDTLNSHMEEVCTGFNTKCTPQVCKGSIVDIPNRGDTPRTPEEVYKEAEVFLKQYFASTYRENDRIHKARLEEVKKELKASGTYRLKTEELVFGAKLAWRNSSRCIGRIQWRKLQVFDCGEVTTASGMFEALCTHIKYATNKGNIRSALTLFKQRTDSKHDYRIWNPQLIAYAGYREPDGTVLGDPSRVEFTNVCLNLGWKPKRTAWEILPLVLSANGKDPEYFEIPPEIIMEVEIEHPRYDWFKELGLRWYALPAVSNMRLDCGGLEFTATAFNGWYMGTEIGCRNLCDTSRFNYLHTVADKMNLDTNNPSSLWKDQALVEINIAVLHSYHKENVSIVDHHTASEQFMKHLDQESKARGGCPSDWVWIVPPMSGSLTAVFHQEMALYYLRPSYDYQEPAWKTHQWTNTDKPNTVRRKFHFRQIARAVKFTSKLFGRALSKRIKATILYATETGKSEEYAKELGTLFGHAFNAQVHCMADYDAFSIEHETLLIIVTSTFGNGEPPANGADFISHLFQMLNTEKRNQEGQIDRELSYKTPTPKSKSLIRTNSILAASRDYNKQLTRLESNKSNITVSSAETIAPLSNVCFAVFALGSSAYPKFCEFGYTIDKVLAGLGGERILDIACGDEMCGQEQEFRTWSSKIFHVACETFCLDENEMIKDAKRTLGDVPLTEDTVRFGRPCHKEMELAHALAKGFRKQLIKFKVNQNKTLAEHKETNIETIFIDMGTDETEFKYEPGDHIGIMAANNKDIVDTVLERLKDVEDYDKLVQVQIIKENLTPTGTVKSWESPERFPPATVRNIFTRFLDITTPPSTTILKYLAFACTDEKDKNELRELATDSIKYDEWKHFHHPHLAEILKQFPSCRPKGSTLAALLPPLQPRFYSISSSPLAHPQKIHATVAVVTFMTQNGTGPTHYGVCSTYLKSLKPGDEVFGFLRRAPRFHMPKDILAPLVLVGPGTGIAPFRGFWHHRREQMKNTNKTSGPIWLFFGCRYSDLELFKEEKETALKEGVLSMAKLALSREACSERKYVQALIENEGPAITRLLTEENGHFYVCGDCKMAEDVQQKLKIILKMHGKKTDEEVDEFMTSMIDENRYHEDIFGITLRTAEVHSASRETARRSRLSSVQSQQ